MENTLDAASVTIQVPWLPPVIKEVDGKTVITRRYVTMPVVGGIRIGLDYGWVNGAN